MKRRPERLVAAALAAVGVAGALVLAFGPVTGADDGAPGGADPSPAGEPAAGPSAAGEPAASRTFRPLVREDFDEGTGPWPADVVASYRRGGAVVELGSYSLRTLLTEVDGELDAVQIAVRARKLAGDGRPQVGVACGREESGYAFVLDLESRSFELQSWSVHGIVAFASGRAGGRADEGRRWTRIRAECAAQTDGRLALRLSIDGRSVHRSPDRSPVDLTSVGLVAFGAGGPARVLFDDLVVAGA